MTQTTTQTELFLTRKQHDAILDTDQPTLARAFAESSITASTRWSLAGVRLTVTEETAAAIRRLLEDRPEDLAARRFFYQHAGFSYDPKTQTPEQGRVACAEALARADRDAASAGIAYEWEQDDITNEEHDESEPPFYYLWRCRAYHPDHEAQTLAACGGIDLGEHGHPEQHPYARVIQAELAGEALETLAAEEDEPAPILPENEFPAVPQETADRMKAQRADFLTALAMEVCGYVNLDARHCAARSIARAAYRSFPGFDEDAAAEFARLAGLPEGVTLSRHQVFPA